MIESWVHQNVFSQKMEAFLMIYGLIASVNHSHLALQKNKHATIATADLGQRQTRVLNAPRFESIRVCAYIDHALKKQIA